MEHGTELTMGSLFDGIGGFPLAAVRNGIRPVWASETEAFPTSRSWMGRCCLLWILFAEGAPARTECGRRESWFGRRTLRPVQTSDSNY